MKNHNIDLITYEELKESVRQDMEEHPIKELANLLLMAMNDWPNAANIGELVDGLKTYYGEPLTVECIKSKKHIFGQDLNSWRAEAGATIIKLIRMSTKFEYESDFDEILKKIIQHYLC